MTTLWVRTINRDEWVNLRYYAMATVRPSAPGESEVVFYDAVAPSEQVVVWRGSEVEAKRFLNDLLAKMNAAVGGAG